MRIQIIDDEPFVLKLLTRQLANLGYQEVLSHSSAEEALACLEREQDEIDVVICDLQMPAMDGVEFIRHISQMTFRGGLVLLSGHDNRILQSVHHLALAHGLKVLGTLQKPVLPAQLQQLLATTPAPEATDCQNTHLPYSPEQVYHAIEQGELVNFYQPIVELAHGEVVALETLVRWQHPTDGLVYPDRFICIAEENGLIHDLSRVVLTNALQQARQWLDAGLQLRVAVNVSMDNLVNLTFPDSLMDCARKAGVPLEQLTLEVTESRLMRDPRIVLDILNRLRLKRVGLAIDDFGTGHSTLTQLRSIPFSILKLDRSFVRGLGHEPALQTIVDANLCMARQLGMKTVAEGVEYLSDWNYLRGTCCDLAQGYFIAGPMPPERLPEWMQDWQRRRIELVGVDDSLGSS